MATWLTIPEGEPAFELVDGALIQKMSPRRRHAIVQGELLLAIASWARGRGDAGTEWRFRISDGAKRHALVPDVAYVAIERLRALRDDEQREEPPFAPDLAVEVLSPGDDRAVLALKIAAYLRCGAKVVLVADPLGCSVALHDTDRVREFNRHDRIEHHAFPGLVIDLGAVFAALDRR